MITKANPPLSRASTVRCCAVASLHHVALCACLGWRSVNDNVFRLLDLGARKATLNASHEAVHACKTHTKQSHMLHTSVLPRILAYFVHVAGPFIRCGIKCSASWIILAGLCAFFHELLRASIDSSLWQISAMCRDVTTVCPASAILVYTACHVHTVACLR